MSIDDKHVMAHASVERNFGDDVHTGVAELERNHGYVWLTPMEEITKISFSSHTFFF